VARSQLAVGKFGSVETDVMKRMLRYRQNRWGKPCWASGFDGYLPASSALRLSWPL